MNNVDKGINQVAESLKKEIEQLESLRNDKIKKGAEAIKEVVTYRLIS